MWNRSDKTESELQVRKAFDRLCRGLAPGRQDRLRYKNLPIMKQLRWPKLLSFNVPLLLEERNGRARPCPSAGTARLPIANRRFIVTRGRYGMNNRASCTYLTRSADRTFRGTNRKANEFATSGHLDGLRRAHPRFVLVCESLGRRSPTWTIALTSSVHTYVHASYRCCWYGEKFLLHLLHHDRATCMSTINRVDLLKAHKYILCVAPHCGHQVGTRQRATFDPKGWSPVPGVGRTMKDFQRPSIFSNLRVLILDNVQGFGFYLYTRNGYHLCQR
jgi:hypothetical protein